MGRWYWNRLRTWLLVSCDVCGEYDRVPTVFKLGSAMVKYPARRKPLECAVCGGPMTIAGVQRIEEPMRTWVNG